MPEHAEEIPFPRMPCVLVAILQLLELCRVWRKRRVIVIDIISILLHISVVWFERWQSSAPAPEWSGAGERVSLLRYWPQVG